MMRCRSCGWTGPDDAPVGECVQCGSRYIEPAPDRAPPTDADVRIVREVVARLRTISTAELHAGRLEVGIRLRTCAGILETALALYPALIADGGNE